MHKDFNHDYYRGHPPYESEYAEDEVNTRRRSILKWAVVGGGAFILGKIFGPSINLFSESSVFGESHIFKNFRVVESGDELGFYDGLGNEILVFEKDPHAGE
jgi:hypothetical protein